MNCKNCGRPIREGEKPWQFEGDELETWCEDCGGEEDRRRREAEIDRLVGALEESSTERIWEGSDLQWHYELLARGPDPTVVAESSEGYGSEEEAREALRKAKAAIVLENLAY